MGRSIKKSPLIDVKSPEEVSEAISVNLSTIISPDDELGFLKSIPEEDSFLDAKKGRRH